MNKKRLVGYLMKFFSTAAMTMFLLVVAERFGYGIRGVSFKLLRHSALIAFFLLIVLNLRLVLLKLMVLAEWGIKALISVVGIGGRWAGKIIRSKKNIESGLAGKTVKSERKTQVKKETFRFSVFFRRFCGAGNKDANKNKPKGLIKYGLIPLILFLLGIKLTLLSIELKGERFNVVVQNLGWNSLSYLKASELMAGEIISGEFTAKNNNLGTVAIRFDTLKRINNDALRFKIKEKGSTQWYYNNDYQTQVFSPDQLFPFGFPKISDSAGRIFQWEIESVSGKEGNAIKLSRLEPVLQIKYEFVQRELIKNPKAFIIFSIKRFGDIINSEYLPLLVIYFSPFFVYLIGIVFTSGINARDLILALLVFLIVANISDVGPGNDYVFGTISILWLVINFIFGLKGKLSVVLGLIFLLLTAIFLSVGNELLSERIAIWAYLFLLAGVILISCEKTSEEHVETK